MLNHILFKILRQVSVLTIQPYGYTSKKFITTNLLKFYPNRVVDSFFTVLIYLGVKVSLTSVS